MRSILASRHVTGATMQIHTTNSVRILTGTHLYIWGLFYQARVITDFGDL